MVAGSRRADVEILLRVSRMYYEQGLMQSEIAARIGYSRPHVSRLLAQAREPVLLVAPLGVLEREEDGALLARAPLGEVAVGARLHALLGQVLAPALDLRARGFLGVDLLVCAHGLVPHRAQRCVVEEVACASTVVGSEAGAPKRRSFTASATLSVTCSPPARTRSDIF